MKPLLDPAAGVSRPALSVHRLSTPRSRVPAVEEVTFALATGRPTALLGPPGSGKSALLEAIAGLDALASGTIEVDGRDVTGLPPHRREIGLVLQEPALLPGKSVAENIRFGLHRRRWRRPEGVLQLAELLRVIGLSQRGEERIDRLSEGERLRVAIARALAPAPRVLLLDDPLAALPAADRDRERVALRHLLERLQVAPLVATSDCEDAMALGGDVAVMAHGRLLQQGAAGEVAAQPSSAEVAGQLGYVVLLDGRVEGDRINELGVGALAARPTDVAGARIEVLVHSTLILAVPEGRGLGGGVSGAVVAARPRGALWQLEVALGEARSVLARWEWDREPPSAGTIVDLATPVEALRFFSRPPPFAPALPQRAPRSATVGRPQERLAEAG